MKPLLKQIRIGLAAIGAVTAGAYALFIRPWQLHWGATKEEVHRPLPGDVWIPHPKMESTRAITIQARSADVWSWLVQMGTGRAGWYSYAWLENLLPSSAIGAGITNAEQIIPEFQHLEVGESIPLSPTTGLTVAALDAPHVLALRVSMSALTGMPLAPDEPKPEAYLDGSWVFVLEALDEQTTRLIERMRADYKPHLRLAPLVYLLAEPTFFVMERKMLLGIKQRAERAGARRQWRDHPLSFRPRSSPGEALVGMCPIATCAFGGTSAKKGGRSPMRNKLCLGLLIAASGAYLVHRLGLRWGATDAEVHRPLPGDEVVPHPMIETTHAIPVRAPRAAIWPWLVQMGYQRAGWYTDSWYSLVDKYLFRLERSPSADHILPQFQHLAVGDTVPDGPPGTSYFTVAALEPERALVLYSTTHGTAMVPRFLRNNPKLGFYGVFSWAFILDEVNENATRLILRTRARGGPCLFMLLNFLLFPPADFLVARLMLRTIKQRAERQAFVRSSSSEERPPAASAAGEPMGSGKVKR